MDQHSEPKTIHYGCENLFEFELAMPCLPLLVTVWIPDIGMLPKC